MYDDPLEKIYQSIDRVAMDVSILRDQINELEQRQFEIARMISRQSKDLGDMNWGLNIIFLAVVVVPAGIALWKWLVP